MVVYVFKLHILHFLILSVCELCIFQFKNCFFVLARKNFLQNLERNLEAAVDKRAINGEWSIWSQWGVCKGVCGKRGKRVHTRICNNPKPARGGIDCIGSNIDYVECLLPGCNMSQYQEIVKEDPIKLHEFNYLESIHNLYPSLMERCIKTECRFETIRSVLPANFTEYWNALHCVKHAVGCPEIGGWSSWTEWSTCSALCGQGMQYALRNCTEPRPSIPLYDCFGDQVKVQPCTISSCIPTGEWTLWSPWTECSVKCGSGIQERTRVCSKTNMAIELEENPNFNCLLKTVLHVATNMSVIDSSQDSPICVGASKEFKFCKKDNCPVDGEWSEWESWSTCSAECGEGTQYRSRTCSDPPPLYGGISCSGIASQVRHCFVQPCAVVLDEVPVFDPATVLFFSSSGNASKLLSLFLVFRPFSPNGIILKRYEEECSGPCSSVVLMLQDGFFHLITAHKNCEAVATWPFRLELGLWYEILITAIVNTITVRVNDLSDISTNYSCKIPAVDYDVPMSVGGSFSGQVKKILINYESVQFRPCEIEKYLDGYCPFNSTNLPMEYVDDEDFTLSLSNLIYAPCPVRPDKWAIIFVVKPAKLTGLVLLMTEDDKENYVAVAIDSRNIIFCLRDESFYEEKEVSLGDLYNNWLFVKMDKDQDRGWGISVNGGKKQVIRPPLLDEFHQQISVSFKCHGDMFFGNIPDYFKKVLRKDKSHIPAESVDGMLTFLQIDDEKIDLQKLVVRNPRDGKFSSSSITSSESYQSVSVSPDQQVNLTCQYNYNFENKLIPLYDVFWLHMNTILKPNQSLNGVFYNVRDNGFVSELIIKGNISRENIEGFYACWAQPLNTFSSGEIIITYGVHVTKSSFKPESVFMMKKPNQRDNNFLFILLLLPVVCSVMYCCLILFKNGKHCFPCRCCFPSTYSDSELKEKKNNGKVISNTAKDSTLKSTVSKERLAGGSREFSPEASLLRHKAIYSEKNKITVLTKTTPSVSDEDIVASKISDISPTRKQLGKKSLSQKKNSQKASSSRKNVRKVSRCSVKKQSEKYHPGKSESEEYLLETTEYCPTDNSAKGESEESESSSVDVLTCEKSSAPIRRSYLSYLKAAQKERKNIENEHVEIDIFTLLPTKGK